MSDSNGDIPRPRDAIYDQLKSAILSSELSPGQQLVETALAAKYGVSRTPIRQALTRLEQDGMVARTHNGLVVRKRSPDEILDIYDVRIGLEANAAATAAVRRTRMDLVALQRFEDRMEAMDGSDREAIAEVNREFHRAIWEASHSEPLIDVLTRLNLHLTRFTATTLAEPGRWREARNEHREVLEAIRDQDAERAARAATRHFEAARNIRLEIWARASD